LTALNAQDIALNAWDLIIWQEVVSLAGSMMGINEGRDMAAWSLP